MKELNPVIMGVSPGRFLEELDAKKAIDLKGKNQDKGRGRLSLRGKKIIGSVGSLVIVLSN